MTVKELSAALYLRTLAGEQGLGRDITGCYVGDLLSWVMGRAKENDVWVTVMGNVNAIAVAKLADISCILLCESAHLDEDARVQADLNGIAVVAAELPAYELAVEISKLLAAGS